MAIVNDVYTVTMNGEIDSEQTANVFTYAAESTACAAQELAVAFWSLFREPLRDMVSSWYRVNSISVSNLNSDTDFYSMPLITDNTGRVGGDPLPSYCAFHFYSPTRNRSMRGGQKRFAGVAEQQTEASSLNNDPVFAANRDTMAGIMSEVIDDNLGGFYKPVIIKRIKTEVGGKVKYELPVTLNGQTYYGPDNWSWKRIISTQISRRK